MRDCAVFVDYLVMHDAIDEYEVGHIPTGEPFRRRFGNPYAVIYRVDVYASLQEGVRETVRVELLTLTRAPGVEPDVNGVSMFDQHGVRNRGSALVAVGGVKSVGRAQYVNDPARVTGPTVYRAVAG